MYAFMQAAGIVNDHMTGRAARKSCISARKEFEVPRPAAP